MYVCTVECDPVLAAARNVHKRSEAEVVRLARAWEDTPGKMNIIIRYSLSTKWVFVVFKYVVSTLNFELLSATPYNFPIHPLGWFG